MIGPRAETLLRRVHMVGLGAQVFTCYYRWTLGASWREAWLRPVFFPQVFGDIR